LTQYTRFVVKVLQIWRNGCMCHEI